MYTGRENSQFILLREKVDRDRSGFYYINRIVKSVNFHVITKRYQKKKDSERILC